MKVICEICNEFIAQVEPGDVSVPMTGSMFKTPDDFHGYDPPFLPDTTWEDMKCGYCNQRPFTERDGFLTDEGYKTIQPTVIETTVIPPSITEEFAVKVNNIIVSDEVPDGEIWVLPTPTLPTELESIKTQPWRVGESSTFVCEVCGKICKGKAALGAHMRVHKG